MPFNKIPNSPVLSCQKDKGQEGKAGQAWNEVFFFLVLAEDSYWGVLAAY